MEAKQKADKLKMQAKFDKETNKWKKGMKERK